MAATTLNAIIARVSSVVAAAPYHFTEALEPFGFDLQPGQVLDQQFCVIGEMDEATPYLGLAQMQIDKLQLRIVRKIRRNGKEAVSLLTADCTSLAASIVRDGVLGDYNGEVTHWEIPTPARDDDFAIAELELSVDYDRSL